MWRKRFSSGRFYRCYACGWRGLGPETGPTFTVEETESATRAVAPDPVNLRDVALDEPRPERPPGISLEALDSDLSHIDDGGEANARRNRGRKEQV